MLRAVDEDVRPGWRTRLNHIIFESDTPEGKAFDVVLLASIILSVAAVMLESVPSIEARYETALHMTEWFFTALFTIEYVLRIVSSRPAGSYVTSFFGVVDLLAILPTYLSLFIPGSQSLLVIRALRLLRVFRVLKLGHYLGEAHILRAALYSSRRKVAVFVLGVLNVVLIVGTMMYLIEGPANGFTSIPTSVYWAIVTMTTVGYGDIAPRTPLGQLLASMLMVTGYGVIAVPTGIVSVELAEASRRLARPRICPKCEKSGHEPDAAFCRICGAGLF